MTTGGALDGLRVVDLSRLLPGPYCSMVLADHGADVIAIEDKRYKADDLFFTDLNRNKRHMTLNLKKTEGREIFFKLISRADIVLEGFRPGVVKRLGVDYASLKKLNPAIIYCSISGYGQDGPMSNSAGHDVNYLSRSGVLDLIGEKDGAPTIPAVQIADIAGGAMNAIAGILLALYERQISGLGQSIDISMTDAMLGFLTLPNFMHKKEDRSQKRSDTMISHRFACYNTYKTLDNKYLAIGAVENRFWGKLCDILGVEEYCSLQYDEVRRIEIKKSLAEIFIMKTLSHWQEKLGEQDVCFSAVQSMEEVYADPLFRARDMVVDLPTDNGVEKVFGIAVKLSRTPGSIRSAPQSFGAATRDILGELGYGQKSIDEFYENGVL